MQILEVVLPIFLILIINQINYTTNGNIENASLIISLIRMISNYHIDKKKKLR